MPTEIKPELSKKSKYYIPRNRYYELLYFCRQYSDFKKELTSLNNCIVPYAPAICSGKNESPEFKDVVSDLCMKIYVLERKINAIDSAIMDLGDIGQYIFLSVTAGLTYDKINARFDSPMPYNRNEFYKSYRKFFWLLDIIKKRDMGD